MNRATEGTEKPTKKEIPRALSVLDNAISALSEEASGLGSQIQGVLVQKPATEKKDTAQSVYYSPVAQQLGAFTIAIRAITERLRDYRADCEL